MTTVAQDRRHWIGTRESTSEPRWERLAAATGLVAAAFMLGSFVLLRVAAVPSTEAKLATWYAGSGHRTEVIVAWNLVAIGAVFSLWFLGELRTVVRRAEGGEGRLATTAYGAGIVSVALFVLGSATLVPIARELTSDKTNFAYRPAVDGHLTQIMGSAAYVVLSSAGILAAVLFAAVAVATLRTGIFPRWFGVASAVGAVLLLATNLLGLLPILLIPVWTIAASVLTIRHVSRPETITLG